jgi:Hemerythrin HHE cation binding domain
VASPAGDRVAALSKQLAETHHELRRRLADLRARTTSPADAAPNPQAPSARMVDPLARQARSTDPQAPAAPGAGPRVPTAPPDPAGELRAHCLAFCGALTTHHQGEDTGLFAALLRERPDLEPTIDKLVEDHGLITGILHRIAELSSADPAKVGPELDGLAAIMESHFRYEERALAEALDAGVPDDGWSTPVLRLRSPRDHR